jgi:hypothetical protein
MLRTRDALQPSERPPIMSGDRIRQRLPGTWKLISAVREDIPSGASVADAQPM